MVQSPSWEANWFAASQEIPRISRSPKVHYRTHKRPPTVSILSQPNPVHIPTPHLLEIRSNSIHPSTPRSPQWSPSLRFSHQNPIHPLSSAVRATCPAHLILLDYITRTILGEEYKSFSSSLCNLLNSPVTSSLPGPNILLNTMFSNTLSFLSSRNVNDQVSHPYLTTGKITVLYILIFKFLDLHKLKLKSSHARETQKSRPALGQSSLLPKRTCPTHGAKSASDFNSPPISTESKSEWRYTRRPCIRLRALRSDSFTFYSLEAGDGRGVA